MYGDEDIRWIQNLYISFSIFHEVHRLFPRECVQVLERESGKKIDVMSLAYNRLMNHVKYMVMRAVRGESIKLDMNEYMEEKHPRSSSCSFLFPVSPNPHRFLPV